MVEVPMPSDCQGETEITATPTPDGTLLIRTWSCKRCPNVRRQDAAMSPIPPTNDQLRKIAATCTKQSAGQCARERGAKAALN